MSFFGKLKFWKKEDEFDFDSLVEKEIHSEKNPMETNSFEEKTAFPEEAPFSTPSFSPSGVPSSIPPSRYPAPVTAASSAPLAPERELELINSKLDTIKALLNSLDQRLGNVERSSTTEKKPKLW